MEGGMASEEADDCEKNETESLKRESTPPQAAEGEPAQDETEETLRAERDTLRKRAEEAERKADQYERDWYDAKSEFGDSMAKARRLIREAEARIEALTKALRRFEWEDGGGVPMASMSGMCSACGRKRASGHAEGCWLAVVLEGGTAEVKGG